MCLRHELIFEGKLGSLLGMNIMTDGYRYETLSVLQPGEVYVFGPPITVGVITDRQGLQSRPIDTYNQGRAAQGWFLHLRCPEDGNVLGENPVNSVDALWN